MSSPGVNLPTAELHHFVSQDSLGAKHKRKWKNESGGAKHRFFFLTPFQWAIALALSVSCTYITALYTSDLSPWISICVGIAMLTVCHMAGAAQQILVLPHIAILIAILQYVLAAWLSYVWPPTNLTYDIGTRLPEYLGYAGPAVLAGVVGWALCLVRMPRYPEEQLKAGKERLLLFDLLIGVGLLAFMVSRFVDVEALNFVVLLIANLRYVGAFGRMLARAPGWHWRIALMLGLEGVLAAGAGMFHELLLWLVWTLAIWMFRFKPRPVVVLLVAVFGLISLPALQESKWRLRDGVTSSDDPWAEYEDIKPDESALSRTGKWLRYLGGALWGTVTLNMESQFISDLAVRYNQGWIVDRIMGFVPEVEPYAEGETIKDAFSSAVVPRFIDPYKWSAGGRLMMPRYAGVYLDETTSMNVGYIGEMYLNFGTPGAWIACGIYTFVLGVLFRLFYRWSRSHPILLAFIPYVFFACCKAEDDLGLIVNWVFKASVIAVLLLLVMRIFRQRPDSTTASRVWLKS